MAVDTRRTRQGPDPERRLGPDQRLRRDVVATAAADHKILQLRVARDQGLDVPRTLVSQDPAAIRAFCRDTSGRVIAKPVKGTTKRFLQTEHVTAAGLPPDPSLRVSPVIYQDCVEGSQHLRINVFGSEALGFSIETEDLDGRRNLKVPIEPYVVPSALKATLLQVLGALRLRMGVFDLKVARDSGRPAFLEVNSQGQFLFLQGICGTDLAGACATFLKQEAFTSRQLGRVAIDRGEIDRDRHASAPISDDGELIDNA